MTRLEELRNRLSQAQTPTQPDRVDRIDRNDRTPLRHGLDGHGVVPPGEMADAIQDRKDFWRNEFRPDSPVEEWLFERLCIESNRADHFLHKTIVLRDEAALQAAETWDEDRALAVAELAARLAGRPELIQPKLMQSKHGALWLIDQWEQVEHLLRKHDGWQESTWSRTLDLLGIPLDLREDATPSLLDPNDPGPTPGLALARRHIDDLKRRLALYLEDRDARARADAEAGLGIDAPELKRLKRDEAACLRRMQWCMNELRRFQRGGGGGGPDGGRRAPMPETNHLDSIDRAGPDPASSPPSNPGPEPEPEPRSAPEPDLEPPAMPVPAAARPAISMADSVRDRLAGLARATNRRSRRSRAARRRRA